MILEGVVITIGLYLAFSHTRRRRHADGTRYLHQVERREFCRHLLDEHEGLHSERHERIAAQGMPTFHRFQQIGKRPNLTLADKFFIAAQLQDSRARERPAQLSLPKVANIAARRGRRK